MQTLRGSTFRKIEEPIEKLSVGNMPGTFHNSKEVGVAEQARKGVSTMKYSQRGNERWRDFVGHSKNFVEGCSFTSSCPDVYQIKRNKR